MAGLLKLGKAQLNEYSYMQTCVYTEINACLSIRNIHLSVYMVDMHM